MQSPGQLIPAGTLVTVPLPATVTSSVKSCVKVAVTARAWLIVTLQAPVPVHAPDQPVNCQPAVAAGVSATGVPSR